MNREWEIVIGLEVHVELSTNSKIFCSCSADYEGEPNTNCCPVCSGMPGTLPVLNEQVLRFAVRAGLALNCEIERTTRFDRKNYFYPDLPKAYQISQLYKPIAHDGYVDIKTDEGEKRIRIHEMHMEEDAGKLVHSTIRAETYPDYNRCGVPLLEIVSEPDFRSAKEVSAYLEKIRMIFSYLGIANFNTQEGSLRADVNLSIRTPGTDVLGTRTEMKNINSISAIVRAIESEASRQIDLLNNGKQVVQETRHWNDDKRVSFSMRSKENAQDYRYFPEPDLPFFSISEEMIEHERDSLPEFVEEKTIRFTTQYGVPEQESVLLTASKKNADLFEAVVSAGIGPNLAANWFIEYVFRFLKEEEAVSVGDNLSAVEFAKLIAFVENGTVNRKTGLEILQAMVKGTGPKDIDHYIQKKHLIVSDDLSLLSGEIEIVLRDNKEAVSDYYAGKKKALGFLVGQIMNKTKGKFSPKSVNELLSDKLENHAAAKNAVAETNQNSS